MPAGPVVVAIVGGGIAGLAAGYLLADRLPHADIVLLEASKAVGGKLRTAELAGITVDVGAEALLVRRPEGVDLARAVGLGGQLITPLTLTARVFAGGASHWLPARTMMGIPSDLEAIRSAGVLSDAGLESVAEEPGKPPLAPLAADRSVGSVVRERLGAEVLDRLVEPLLGGVYAGRADELSLAATMPALFARLHADGGSLVEAARAVTDIGATASSVSPAFTSLAGGLGSLASAVAASGRFAVRTGVTVREIRRTPSGFALGCGPVPAAEQLLADAVVIATPAAKTSALLAHIAPAAGTELAAVRSASMAIVSLAFRGVNTPSGSGVLVADREGFAVKALTLSSQKWPGAPAGTTLLRASVGRIGETRDLQRDDVDLAGLVRRELRRLIGLDATPIDWIVTRWGGALPQYGVGHVERVVRIRAAVARIPALAVCGATYDGVGVPACIGSAQRAVDRIVDGLNGQGQ
jgi:protoporphyrinogen/coproporphyrinogen III oxidase